MTEAANRAGQPVEELLAAVDLVAYESGRIAQQSLPDAIPASRFALRLAIGQALLLGRILGGNGAVDASLTHAVRGKPENPSVTLDYIAGKLAGTIAGAAHVPLALRVEEKGDFEHFGVEKTKRPLYLAIHDPIDESKNIGLVRSQSTGVVVTNMDGEPVAIAVASLVDPRVVFWDGNGPRFFRLDVTNYTGHLRPDENRLNHTWKNGGRLRIGILKRRIDQDPSLTQLPIFQRTDVDWVYDMSGYELLNLVDPLPEGPVTHALIDPKKGQPWFELPYPWLAYKLGYPVLTSYGVPPQFEKLVRVMYEHPEDGTRTDTNAPRLPFVVAQNEAVLDALKSGLSLK